MIGILGAAAAGVVALGGTGLAAAGNALFDLALNPRAPRSILARAGAGASAGVDTAVFAGDPARREARLWFDEAKRPVELPLADGGVLHGWRVLAPGVVPSPGGGRDDGASTDDLHRYLILCHGYSGRPSDLAREARAAHAAGFSVLLPAARGHERNADRYATMGCLDARDLVGWARLVASFDPRARIALYGVSMGGAEVMMASGLDLPDQVRCIVEDCGYTSAWDECEVQMGQLLHLPARPLLDAADAVCRARAGFSLREASAVEGVRRARVPMLFIHGSADDFVPFGMLDRVFEACASPVRERAVFEGAGHGACSYADPARYAALVGGFLDRHL